MHNLSRFILWAIHWAYKKNSCVWADNVTLPWQHYNILHSLIFASNVSCKDKDSLQQHSFIYLLYWAFTFHDAVVGTQRAIIPKAFFNY